MRPLVSRLAALTASALTGTLSLVIGDATPAYAHCGHDCGTVRYLYDQHCDPQGALMISVWEVYNKTCSGTCYNGGTSGCCDSPEACAGAPCKPGGCGGACEFLYWEETSKPSSQCGV